MEGIVTLIKYGEMQVENLTLLLGTIIRLQLIKTIAFYDCLTYNGIILAVMVFQMKRGGCKRLC